MEQTNYNAIVSEKSTTSFYPTEKAKSPFKNSLSFLRRLRSIPILLIVAAALVLGFFGIKQVTSQSSGEGVLQPAETQSDLSKPTAQKTLNRTFTFPLKDQQGQEVGKLSYTIESVELRDQIIVQGQPASAINGKTFLIINVKLTNNYNQTVMVNARDYLRISIGNSSEKIAPDMHSDPVEVQAISTKPTRVGMAINKTDKNIVLQVGEITGEKESIKISF